MPKVAPLRDTVTAGATLDKIKMASDSARLAKVRALLAYLDESNNYVHS